MIGLFSENDLTRPLGSSEITSDSRFDEPQISFVLVRRPRFQIKSKGLCMSDLKK